MNYECMDNFMVRTPALPIKYLLDYENQDKDIYEFISSNDDLDKFFRKALIISSPSLYNSYVTKPKDSKKYDNMNESLLKYFIRSIVRTTPYGYYSEVSMGMFGKRTLLEKGEHLIDLKVDNNWLNSLIYKLEFEEDIFPKMKLKMNSICYISGNRYKNPYFTNHGEIDGRENSNNIILENSINYTPLIELIRIKAATFITYEELRQQIKMRYDGASDNLIYNTISMLLENEFIISNLRLPAYFDDGLAYILENLNAMEYNGKYYNQIVTINKMMIEIRKTENVESIKLLYTYMQRIIKSKDYLLLNVGNILRQNVLEFSIKKKVEKLANTLSQIPVKFDNYTAFQSKFLEIYGDGLEVPVLEIIDQNAFDGLALFDINKVENTKTEELISKKINNKVFEAILNNEDKIDFTCKDFSDLDVPKSTESFDLNILITKVNGEYNLELGSNVGSQRFGNMLQRFERCLDNEMLMEYEMDLLQKKIELYNDNYILVEAREFYTNGKLANVVNGKKNYQYFILFGNNYEDEANEITLDDMVVGIQNDEIYLRSIKHNKRILVFTNHMLNTNFTNPVLKMLLAISGEREQSPIFRVLSLTSILPYKYMPQIDFEGITVLPSKWFLDEMDLNSRGYDEFKVKLINCKIRYKMDSIIYLINTDHRIVVNLDKTEYIKLLYATFRKQKKLEFSRIQKGFLTGALISDINDNMYINECVFSLVSKEQIASSVVPERKYNSILCSVGRRKNLCQDGWVYFKLYGIAHRDNEIISEKIPDLLKSLICKEHFFIRYSDNEGGHLRVRLKFKNERTAFDKLPSLVNWLNTLLNQKLINHYLFDVYEREINRYGGAELIEKAEKIFICNSLVVEKVLYLYDLSDEKYQELSYIYGIVNTIKGLTEDIWDMCSILDRQINISDYRKEYKKKAKEYMQIVDDINAGIVDKYLGIDLQYKAEKIALSDFKEAMQIQFNCKKNTNDRDSIIMSIAHMHCNRLTGIRELESKYMAIVRHSLYQIARKREILNEPQNF